MKKTHGNGSNCSKNKFLFLNLVIIIVLIIIILLLLRYCGNRNLGPNPTGNIDIFDLKCNTPTCKENKPEPTSPGGNDSTNNTTPVIKDDEEEKNPEEDVLGFNVFDNKITWTTESELRIFTNPAYEFADIIAPGSSNSYVFRVRNNNDFNVLYDIDIEEENIYSINLKYKLKKGDIYLAGSDEVWVSYNTINLNDIPLDAHKYDEYTLLWKWIESPNDTEIGTTDGANYKLKLEITGIEV